MIFVTRQLSMTILLTIFSVKVYLLLSFLVSQFVNTTFVIVKTNVGELQMIRVARATVPERDDGGKDK